MNEKNMLRLIEAYISISNLNNTIIKLTNGYGISGEDFDGVYKIYDVIYDNSKYAGREDDQALDEFRAIMNGIGLSAEERYNLLV